MFGFTSRSRSTSTLVATSPDADRVGDDHAALGGPSRELDLVPAGAELPRAERHPLAAVRLLVHRAPADLATARVEADERRARRAVGARGPPRVDRPRAGRVEVEPERRRLGDRRRVREPVAAAVVARRAGRRGPRAGELHPGDRLVVIRVVAVDDDLAAAAVAA